MFDAGLFRLDDEITVGSVAGAGIGRAIPLLFVAAGAKGAGSAEDAVDIQRGDGQANGLAYNMTAQTGTDSSVEAAIPLSASPFSSKTQAAADRSRSRWISDFT